MSSLPESKFFATSVDNAVAHVELNNGDEANAMTPDFWTDLPIIMNAINESPTIRAVVISGRGKHFTGGMDLSAFQGIIELTQKEPGRAAYALRDLKRAKHK